jgi:RNA polymerase-binding transcription factor DksA
MDSKFDHKIKHSKNRNSMVFTLEDVREIIQQKNEQEEQPTGGSIAELKHSIIANMNKSQSSQMIGAASIADILGFNPNISKQTETRDKDPSTVPAKYRKYYKLLLKLKSDLRRGLSRLTKESHLSYGAEPGDDADMEAFDSGFALSLMSSEQEALTEVEMAIERIHTGTYGVCELTGRPIEPERLAVVPFTRFSLEGQKAQERLKVAKDRTTESLFEGEQPDEVGEFSEYEDE